VFTGLVQALGTVRSIDSGPAATRISIDPEGWPHRPEPGASIAVNGCCLTVVAPVEEARPLLLFDAIPQTLRVTSLGALRVGDRVNLEHAATPTTFLGGHVVLGHVDALAEIVSAPATDPARHEGEWRVRVRLAPDLAALAVDKGSITLDGVSLTIAAVEDHADGGATIDVCLIPETLARTNLAARRAGDRVNVEGDYLAKLVARRMEWLGRRGS
jgi:riboflavin synthase